MNQQLVRGQALIEQSEVQNWDKALDTGFNAGLQAGAIVRAKANAEKKAINNKVAGYINQLSSDIDLTELTESQGLAVKNYLVKERNNYAQMASRLARIEDPSSSEYSELVDGMNSVRRSFANLSSQLKNYKEEKVSYLKDFDDRRISNGNDLGSLSNASKIYTNEGEMGIGPGGQLTFWNENKGDYENYSTIQKPFLKDFKAAESFLKVNESVYNSGKPLDGAREKMLRNRVNTMISAGGRDTLLSLATDDFIVEGGLNIQDQSLFEPGNEDALREFVVDSYMNALSDTAEQGYRDNKPRSSSGSRSGNSQNGMTPAMQAEIQGSVNVAQEALQIANLATIKATGRDIEEKTYAIVDAVNRIDPKAQNAPYVTRGQMYSAFREEMDLKDSDETRNLFKRRFGNSQIYRYNASDPLSSRPSNIDTRDPKALYEFYLKNSDASKRAINYHLNNWDNYTKPNTKEVEAKVTPKTETTKNFG